MLPMATMLPLLMSGGRNLLGLGRAHITKNSTYYMGAVAGYMGMLHGHIIPIINRDAVGFFQLFGIAPVSFTGTLGKVKTFAQGYTFGALLRMIQQNKV